MGKQVRSAHRMWIVIEHILGIPALLGLSLFVVFFVPDLPPATPNDVLSEKFMVPVCRDETLRQVDLTRELRRPNPDFTYADLRNMNLSRITFPADTQFLGADLSGAILTDTVFDKSKMRCARLANVTADEKLPPKFLAVDLTGAKLDDANLKWAVLQNSTLVGATLSGTRLNNADLRDVNFTKAKLIASHIGNARLGRSDFNLADYRPVDAPNAGDSESIENIDRILLGEPRLAGLKQLAKAFENAGLHRKAKIVSATADRWQRHFDLREPNASMGKIVSVWIRALVFGCLTVDGTQPIKPFWLLAAITLLFAIGYWISLAATKRSKRKLFHTIRAGDNLVHLPIPEGVAQTATPAVMFSLSTAVLIAVRIFKMYNVLDLASKSVGGLASYTAKGWVRRFANLQVLVTLSLIFLILITR